MCYDRSVVFSNTEQDASDLEFQSEIQKACEAFLHATGGQRTEAKGHYLKLLGAFSVRVLARDPRIEGDGLQH